MDNLIFLKLGGSLITDKFAPHVTRPDIIQQIVYEIKQTRGNQKIIIGHGSGSFGHVPAKKYQTRDGVHDHNQWMGFAEVWQEARALNQVLVEAFSSAGLPLIAFPPSSSCITDNRVIQHWPLEAMLSALEHGIIPLINGDTIFDRTLGGTILSTEDFFIFLAQQLSPSKILLAGIEPGVWKDFPKCTTIIPRITPSSYAELHQSIGESAAVDVTGGMQQKVQTMLEIIQSSQKTRCLIFSGLLPGNISRAINGEAIGTWIENEK